MSLERLNITIQPYEKPTDDGQSLINIFDKIILEPNKDRISFNIAFTVNYIGKTMRYLVSSFLLRKSHPSSDRTSYMHLDNNFLIPDEEEIVPSNKRLVLNHINHLNFENIKLEKGFYVVHTYAIDVSQEQDLNADNLFKKYYPKEKLKSLLQSDDNLVSVSNFEVL